MNKLFKYTIFILCILSLQSCVKDMQDELNNGGWNHERSILNLQFKNQIGSSKIERIDDKAGEVAVILNTGAITDLSKVEVESILLSYQATASIKKGETLDFNNPEQKAKISVTSTLGEIREYTIYASGFRETIEGKWSINDLVVFGGTGLSYGGGQVFSMQSKSWCWYNDFAPRTEYDNILTFILDGINDDGSTTGICINDAGADGKYADFIFQGSQNRDNPGTDLDLKHFYRQIPEGESRWIRNYSSGTISFTDKDGKVTTGKLEEPGSYDLGFGYSVTVANNAFSFILNGADDWANIYNDFDKVVKRPRAYYIMVTKLD